MIASARRRRRAGLGRLALLLGVAIVAVAVLVPVLSSGGPPALPLPGIGRPARSGDPFGYAAGREAQLAARGAAGNAHVLYVKSPGGVVATAARVARWRPLINQVVAGKDIDPATIEAIVFLESAGDPNALAGADPANAAGLTQIVASTGQALLGMHIDLARSRRLTAQIERAAAAGDTTAVLRLERARAKADERFDPDHALAATVRYLELARRDFGRDDLAVVSYHMGIGNLMSVLAAYDGGRPVSYAQLFFDTAPDNRPEAYRILSGFGDDSWTYYWRVLAAAEIMRAYRSDPAGLRRMATLQTARGSAAYALHPVASAQAFSDPTALDEAYARRVVLPLPSNARALGLAYDSSMGSLARRVGATPALYRGLRGPALDLLIELAARVRKLSGGAAPLIVTSSVVDRRYQRALGIDDPVAAAGWSFTIARRYVRPRQALGFQALLDRLQSLNLIAWERYPTEIEITVASDASRVIVSGP